MCRSIKTLRPPFVPAVTQEEVDAAALQYVRKVAGMRAPSARNREAFETAVLAVAAATHDLLRDLQVRPVAAGPAAAAPPTQASASTSTSSRGSTSPAT